MVVGGSIKSNREKKNSWHVSDVSLPAQFWPWLTDEAESKGWVVVDRQHAACGSIDRSVRRNVFFYLVRTSFCIVLPSLCGCRFCFAVILGGVSAFLIDWPEALFLSLARSLADRSAPHWIWLCASPAARVGLVIVLRFVRPYFYYIASSVTDESRFVLESRFTDEPVPSIRNCHELTVLLLLMGT